MAKDLLNRKDFAAAAQINPDSIYHLLSIGVIVSQKIGKLHYFEQKYVKIARDYYDGLAHKRANVNPIQKMYQTRFHQKRKLQELNEYREELKERKPQEEMKKEFVRFTGKDGNFYKGEIIGGRAKTALLRDDRGNLHIDILITNIQATEEEIFLLIYKSKKKYDYSRSDQSISE